jgi:diguanylate cyclase (GGDEF)-like protein/PAS domain S-box-containing protein
MSRALAAPSALAEQRIVRLTNLCQARGELINAIVEQREPAELFALACRLAVELCGMRMAWVGVPGAVGGRLEPAARHGSTLAGGDASATFPIFCGGARCAVLAVHGPRAHAFDEETMDLLGELAKDIGFALDGLERARQRREALDALHRSQRHFRAFFERSSIGMAATGPNKEWLEANEALCRMLGYTREELVTRTWLELTHPDDAGVGEQAFKRILSGELDEFETDKRYLHRSGRVIDTHVEVYAVRDGHGRFEYSVVLLADITKRKQAERELREQNEFLSRILQSEPECVKVVDRSGVLTQMNQAGLRMLGVGSVEEARAAGLLTFVLPQYQRSFADLHRRVCDGGSGVLEFEIQARDGTRRWLETHATHLRNAAGDITGLLGITRDISENKRSAELIWRQANFDILTGLPNRYMFRDRLAQEIRRAHRTAATVALLYIDLDRFKEVNDSLGHDVGDRLLQEAAQRIASCVRESDAVARLGGDEFTVILTQLARPSDAQAVAESIVTRLREPFALGADSVFVSASAGIARYPADADEVDGLLKMADQAMYAAKRQGRNRVCVFTGDLQDQAHERMRLVNDLRGALAQGQLCLHFQPIVDLSGRTIRGAEALLRWNHPLRGWIPPQEFIGLAEETGLIGEIGDWVFREAARCAAHWRRSFDPELKVSVNISPAQFRQCRNVRAWCSHLRELGLPGQAIAIEITEGLLLDADEEVVSALAELRACGIGVCIDDFGTGYSSLAYLQKFQVDCIKIDRSFIHELDTERNARTLTESIIAMAHKLGLHVVAEGVETEAQRSILLAAACESAQGYLFSRPVPPLDLEALLARRDGPGGAPDYSI